MTGAAVESEPDNASAELLARWLEDRLGVPVDRVATDGPVVTGVVLRTTGGEIRVDRPAGALATLILPGSPDRRVALKVRSGAELIAEERAASTRTWSTAPRCGGGRSRRGSRRSGCRRSPSCP